MISLIEKRISQIHAVRGFAALLVVIAHAKFPFWIGGQEYIKKYPTNSWMWYEYPMFLIDMLTSNATVMVVVFFVLSGFFMAYSFDKTSWKTSAFYWNRSLRIYIPYLFSIFLAISLILISNLLNPELFKSINPREYNVDIIAAYNDLGIGSFLYSLVFMPKNNYIAYNYPYWSLYVEAIFYLICPLIFYKKPNWFYIVSIILVLLNLYSIFSGFKLPKILNPTFYFYAFAIGIFTYNFFKSNFFNNYIFSIISKKNLFFDFLLLLFFVVVMLGGLKFDKKVFYIIAGVLTPLYIGRVLFYERSIWVKKYINPIMVFLGKISFSLYLVHVPFFILFYSVLVKFTGKEAFESRIYWLFVLLAIPFGYFMYKLVEEKSLTFIKKMRANKKLTK